MKIAYDFHIHSCLSPCGDNDMTPANICGMAKVKSLLAIAVTDHNTCGNCSAVMNAAKEHGIIAVPGMELETSEEVHVICLFETVEMALKFSSEVYRRLPEIKNRVDIYGEQILMDSNDKVISKEERLLHNATSIGIDDLPGMMASYKGVAIPAHIDKDSNSILATLGFITPDMGFSILELSKNCRGEKEEALFLKHPYLNAGYSFVCNSDAHYLWDINEADQCLEVEECSIAGIFDALNLCCSYKP